MPKFSTGYALLFVWMTCGWLAPHADAAEGGDPFDKGNWALTLSGSYIPPTQGSDATLGGMSVSVGYFAWNGHMLSLDLAGYGGEQDGGDGTVWIGAAGLLGRWHFVRGTADRWSIFFDGGGAVSYADHNFPASGLNFNFVLKGGFGGSLRVGESAHLLGGVRWLHLSNAAISGRDENPGYNGAQIWAGMMWTW
jgi:hypothetical protein